MRKSSLVKAMACFMAATMAVACVPGANVTNGVAMVADAAETAVDPAVKASEVFSLNSTDFAKGAEGLKEKGCAIVGSGKLIETDDPDHKHVFHNAAGEKGIRTNYMTLPEDVLKNAVSPKGELTISMDVNVGTASVDDDYFHAPLFSAYVEKAAGDNGLPMMIIQSRGIAQVNCDGWTDFTDAENVNGKNAVESTAYLDDKKWHKVTVTFTKAKAIYYIDGKIINEWNIDDKGSDGLKGGLNGFLTADGASKLKYVCLGGNQAWGWTDKDAAYYFDNVSIYSSALTGAQVRELAGANPCEDITFENTDNATVAVNVPFDLKAKLTGVEAKPVTEDVTASAVNATIKVSKSDGEEYILAVTPTEVTKGAITVKCGEKEKTYRFNAIKNTVDHLESTNGNAFTAMANQVTAFEIKAVAAHPSLALDANIEIVSGTAIATRAGIGVNSIVVTTKVNAGDNLFRFKCGGKTLDVIITGITSTTAGTTTPNTPGSSITPATPDDNKDNTVTGPAIDADKPGDNNTDNKPADNDNNNNNTGNNTPADNDNNSTTTKKKAKITSATAKKGKKVVTVSGKVTKKATVKVTAAGKTLKTTANKNGKFSVKFSQKVSKKIKKKAKVKIVVTRSGYTKATKTIKVK